MLLPCRMSLSGITSSYLCTVQCVHAFAEGSQDSTVFTEPEFVNLLRGAGIDSPPDGPVRQLYIRTSPPGFVGRRNRFLGIDSWAR
jgi:hypothetical protein